MLGYVFPCGSKGTGRVKAVQEGHEKGYDKNGVYTMVKVGLKTFLEKSEYERLEKLLSDDKYKYLFGGTESGAGRFAFSLLFMYVDGRIEIKDKIQQHSRPF